ncbi:Fic family protein [Kineococcus xinjiangensis]|uniref:Fic family protein n=1 Tax=Kineococcus xinjiangensis TaxID=512762 RepID=A0A2S6IHS9_9ACTN|nr:Fic family protein [Kineococcus xinjiangensis]PPK93745.1 Fic family protein [Kineococcus xinjiangensis]
MPRLVRATWSPDPADVAGLPRRHRQPCTYDAHVPDPLVGREVLLPADVAADVSDAERAVQHLNTGELPFRGYEAVARLLLRAEAVASSRIEGLEIGGRRLARADAARRDDGSSPDAGAAEVLGNIDAMRAAVDDVARRPRIGVEGIRDIHHALLHGTRDAAWAGRVRTTQNWIGGGSYNPCQAEFVPPPPGEVAALLEDLADYLESDLHPPLVQAALAHAQFETIHPFPDGNGRTGRALIHVVLTRRGLSPRHVPPISLVLATRGRDYVAGLTSYRDPDAPRGVADWIATFAAATTEACGRVAELTDGLAALRERWREAVGAVRAGSTVELLLDEVLAQLPVLTVAHLVRATGRSDQAVNEAVERLHRAGVLQQTSTGRRNRTFEVAGLVDLLTGFERSLASPAGDTAVAPPVRAVPVRPRPPR